MVLDALCWVNCCVGVGVLVELSDPENVWLGRRVGICPCLQPLRCSQLSSQLVTAIVCMSSARLAGDCHNEEERQA